MKEKTEEIRAKQKEWNNKWLLFNSFFVYELLILLNLFLIQSRFEKYTLIETHSNCGILRGKDRKKEYFADPKIKANNKRMDIYITDST